VPRPPVANPVTRRVYLNLSEQAIAALDELAASEGIPRAAYMRRAVIRDLMRQSRAAQGLPEHVEDAATLERVAHLLDGNAP
jgi:Ribbon-helix-helix protein, copG family